MCSSEINPSDGKIKKKINYGLPTIMVSPRNSCFGHWQRHIYILSIYLSEISSKDIINEIQISIIISNIITVLSARF